MTLLRTPARGCALTDPVEEVEEGLGAAEAAHPAEHRRRGVLEGQVVPRHDPGRLGHRLEQAGTHLGGLEVGDAHPLDALDGGQLGQELLEQREVAEVLAVRRRVLADEEQLAHALAPRASAPRRGRRSGGGTRTTRGTSGWRRTSSAGRSRWRSSGAPTGARRAGPARPARRRRRDRAARHRRRPRRGRPASAGAAGGGRTARARPASRRRGRRVRCDGHVAVGVEAEHGVGVGQLVGERLAVALGEAPDGDDGPGAAGLLEVGGLEEGVDRVLLGLLDEAARVDDRDVGLGGVVDEGPALGGESARRAPRSPPRCACTRG